MFWRGVDIVTFDAPPRTQELDVTVVAMPGITGIAGDGPYL